MPITIKTEVLNVKGDNGYTTLDTVSDGTTQDRIGAINAAGAAQVNAVQAKGEQTLASIPSDYTSLNHKIENVMAIQPDEPTSQYNKMWIDSDAGQEYEVPDMTEFNALGDEVDKKTEKHLLNYDGTHIKDADGTVLTFDALYEMLMNKPDFVVLVHNNYAYHPNGVSTSQIVFSASYPVNGYDRNHRITMLSSGAITVNDSESEMTSSRVSSIAEADKDNTKKYTSVKAVVDYVDGEVDELKDALTDLSAQSCVSIVNEPTNTERHILRNLRYIRAVGIDLDGWRISGVLNTEQYPHTIILRNANSAISVNVEAETYPTVISNTGYTIYVGYDWTHHTTNLNVGYENSHIEINVKGSEVPDLDQRVSDMADEFGNIDSRFNIIESDISDIKSDLNEYEIGQEVAGKITKTNHYINDVGDKVFYAAGSWADDYSVTSYPVIKGKNYRLISAAYNLNAAYAGVVFTTTNISNQPTTFTPENGQVLIDKTYATITRVINMDYTPNIDGYLLIARSPDTVQPIVVYAVREASKLDRLDAQVNKPLTGKVIYTLGDSITFINGMWAHQLAGKTGAKVYNLARGGARWSDRGTNQIDYTTDSPIWNNPFVFNTSEDGLTESYPDNKNMESNVPPCDDTNYTTISNEIRFMKRLMSEFNRPMPDYIVIACGINDVSQSMPDYNADLFNDIVNRSLALNAMTNAQKSTIYGGLRWCIETLMNEYPNAQIIISTPIQSAYGYLRPYIYKVNNWIKAFHVYYATQLIDAYAESGISAAFEKGWDNMVYVASGMNGRYLSDGLHPNTAGRTVHSNFMAKQIVQKSCDKT